MMEVVAALVMVAGLVPIAVAWRAHPGSTIRHPLAWTAMAGLTWIAAAILPAEITRFAALCFTGGAGVAVLGARRPIVGAWNFIVASLIIVMLLAWAERWIAGAELQLSTVRWIFLAILIAMTVINYLPTRLAGGALFVGIGCGLSLARLKWSVAVPEWVDPMCIGIAPLAGWLGIAMRPECDPFDEQWRTFRDRYGAVWAQRLREQFTATAKNASWPIELTWQGGRGERTLEAQAALTALQKRFGTE